VEASHKSTPPPLTHSGLEAGETVDDRGAPRFPLARRGYDCVAVDVYVADLEQELAALDRELAKVRGSVRAEDDVASELKRLGKQTSAVLMAAHEQREEILRRAHAEAEGRIANATATASAVTAQCEERLRDLKAQTDAAQAERGRLLGELREISAALAAVADSADEHAPIAT
jgi:chromosome segregation ATPase